ncbi:MAG: hypothetical protein ABW208_23840 [Pyrinomonadaceae bacterium]
MKSKVIFPREVLLVEIERWCGDHVCNARTRLSLTKAEARDYTGFECSRCERWNEDALGERDIPEWWEELKVASLEGLRPPRGEHAPGDPGEVVARTSDARHESGESAEFVEREEEGRDSL